ncbi:MAG TPA: oxidoreductase [Natronosporangium sp.]
MTTELTAAASGSILIGGERKIHRMGFGAMRLPVGESGGPPRSPEAGMAVLRRAVALGVNHIDTAGFYSYRGVSSHELIREALSPYPEELLIATKVGPMLDETGLPGHEAEPGQLRGLVEEDLRRLGVDRLDLVYLRVGGIAPPSDQPIGKRFEVLAGLREEGLIAHLGVSNVTEAQFDEARSIAPVAVVQNHFHVHHRADAQLLAKCAALGVAYVPFFPLGGGERPLDQTKLAGVAERHQATTAQIALAWLLATSPVTCLIPGTGALAHLEENIAAAGITLTEQDLAELAATR